MTRPEVVEFRKFLQMHSEETIRQGVLHRDEIGIQFVTLQKKALTRCNTAPQPTTSIAPDAAVNGGVESPLKYAPPAAGPVQPVCPRAPLGCRPRWRGRRAG
jgi:hypothetical protein